MLIIKLYVLKFIHTDDLKYLGTTYKIPLNRNFKFTYITYSNFILQLIGINVYIIQALSDLNFCIEILLY